MFEAEVDCVEGMDTAGLFFNYAFTTLIINGYWSWLLGDYENTSDNLIELKTEKISSS